VKQIVFISGKGGTGKSTLVASLVSLVKEKMIADCDVEAPNLHLLLQNELLKKDDYFGAQEAVIDSSLCNGCGICRRTCRFAAIGPDYTVIPLKCEGCGACTLVCPQKAVRLEKVRTGKTYVSRTAGGTFSHALLDIRAEGSGKLVTEVKKKIIKHQKDEKWVLVDGSPGIGCVVIASITGADAAVVVAEPTLSGKSDLERVLAVAAHFNIPVFVCINKYGLNPEAEQEIEDFCRDEYIPVIGRIPYDRSVVTALQELKTPVEAGNKIITAEIERIWQRIVQAVRNA
jgi:MinD superfamily P-loop ATPase